MPDTDILVSELPDTIAENSTDLMMLTQPDAQSDTGYSTAKTTLEKVAIKGLHGIEYETLLPKFASGERNITDAINQLLSNLADDYSTSATYSVGDCVIYNGKIYECITDISVAEAWNSSHWTQIKAVDAGSGGGGSQNITETKSGAVVNFETSLELPLEELKANIVAQQAGGTPTPSSPLPISGVSSVGLTHTGKNLFDKNNANVVTGYIGNTQFNTNNANTKTVYISIKPNTIYTVSKRAGQRFVIATSPVIPTNSASFTSSQTGHINSSLTITAGADDKYLWAWLFLDGTDTGTLEEMLATVQIEVGSTATAYEPYSAETKTIALGQTVYGGSVDCINGTGLKTWSDKITIDGSVPVNNVAQSSGIYYVVVRADLTGVNTTLSDKTVISDKMKTETGVVADDRCYITGNGAILVCVLSDQTITTKEQAREWFQNHPTTFIYELETPTEITGLTPANFTTIEGEQNIFADCGDVTVEYFTTDASDTVDLIKAVGGVKRTVLMDTWNDFANGTTIALSEDVDKFDELIIYASHIENNSYYAHRGIMRVDRETILWSISESAYSDEWRGLIDCIGSYQNNQVYSAFDFRFTDKRTIKSVSKTVGTWPYAQCGIEKIIGVKYN